jgi:hypothetical protein
METAVIDPARVHRAASSPTMKPSITFVCCVESGPLEDNTLRMIESLRRYGGRFKDCDIVAVTPRFGPSLSSATLAFFERHRVRYIRARGHDRYAWFKFLNKPLAVKHAEAVATTDSIAWMDSDLLIVGEPDQLELEPGEDFRGFPVECKEMGTTGPGDAYEQLWSKFGQRLGIGLDELPWVTAAETNERVRMYFNGGIFVYRRNSGFGDEYLRICIDLLDLKVGASHAHYNVGVKEMSAIGFAVVKLRQRWSTLPYSHDYVMMSRTHKSWYREDRLREARVVHYHDAMWPPFWDTFIDCLTRTHPEPAAWLRELGPMRNPAAPHRRLIGKLLRTLRERSELRYRSECVLV